MKFFSCVADFAHTWQELASALWQRYPNPFSKHVLTEDVLERHVMTDGKLYSLKLLTKTNPLPRWAIPLYNGPKFVTIVEESIVDPITQTFTTYTRNISLSHFMSCTEKCIYKISESNPENSQIEKSIWLDSNMGYGLKRPILEFSMSRYKSNQVKASLGLEYALTHGLPPTLKERLKLKTDKFTETAKQSTERISKTAILAISKAEEAKNKAKSKAELAKSVKASEG